MEATILYSHVEIKGSWAFTVSGVARVEKVEGSNRPKKLTTFFFGSRALCFWHDARYASQFSLFIDTLTLYVQFIT